MRVHHVNCGSLREIEPLDEPGAEAARAVCHVLVVETDADGLVLVDAGLGTGDVADPAGRLGDEWTGFAEPVLDEAETALRRVEALGFAASDVRHIVPTHLHRDHAGGLSDFPDAAVHVFAAERECATTRQFDHGPKWAVHGDGGETWAGFEGVRPLAGGDVLLVPLGGHSPGHAGVAVRGEDGWLLHAGDAYFHHGELRAEPRVHPVMELVQKSAEVDRELRLRNVARLRELEGVDVFCAHDPWELMRYR
ncbi:MBL fold metallo-hydrolase [Actinomadura sediminis]|uniref:MBL fold metallo-hydrolase n=1 Tax=Actinomadura sediminis TaxID=1038904 RepID=A0ABW3EWN0_9ACTN